MAKKERKIIRGILGPNFKNGINQKRSNTEVYMKIERITETFWKRRITFYGHLKRMDNNRLTKKIFEFFDSKPKTTMPLFVYTKQDLKDLQIQPEDAFDRGQFRRKVAAGKTDWDSEQQTGRRGVPWTETRKQVHSQ